MLKLAHIINPVAVGETSDLHKAQPITFESMRLAKIFSKEIVDVEQYSVAYAEDCIASPDDFLKTRMLERSVLDIQNFAKDRKLPLIKDILDRLYEVSDADYFIYTNVDIALMPFFYASLSDIINQGYDAFVINRRTISDNVDSVEDIHLMYADAGAKHLGYDCFVFKRSSYSNYELGNACIGANWIGKAIITNLICNANNFQLFTDLHLTFHIGNDKTWKNPDLNDYEEHNRKELKKILTHNAENVKINHPIINDVIEEISIKDMSRLKYIYTHLINKIKSN